MAKCFYTSSVLSDVTGPVVRYFSTIKAAGRAIEEMIAEAANKGFYRTWKKTMPYAFNEVLTWELYRHPTCNPERISVFRMMFDD